jgi:cyclophilin family peptidyl-prolyl cis-trans isomerase
VIPDFMAQGGDPKGDGSGGSPLPDLKAEFNSLPHLRGTVSAARAAEPDSANSQFYIMFVPRVSLDGKYTVFGRVVSGMNFVDQIAVGEPPAEPTRIVGRRWGVAASSHVATARQNFRLHGSRCKIEPLTVRHVVRRALPMKVDLSISTYPRATSRFAPRARDSARMLLVEGDRLTDRACATCRPAQADDVLVFNDTKVIPAQLEGRRGEARIGATLHKRHDLRSWWAFVRNAKRVRRATRSPSAAGSRRFARTGGRRRPSAPVPGDEAVELLLHRAGTMPLPPYIASKRDIDEATLSTTRRCSRPRRARLRRRPPRCTSRRAGHRAWMPPA